MKSILSIPHAILAVLCIGSYIVIAITMLLKRINYSPSAKLVQIFAWIGLVGVFLLVDSGFYMYRIEQIATSGMHHPFALAAMLTGGLASIFAMMSKKRPAMALWSCISATTTVLCLVLTSLFVRG